MGGYFSANITAEIHVPALQLFDFACAYAEDSIDPPITGFQGGGGVRRVPPYQVYNPKPRARFDDG